MKTNAAIEEIKNGFGFHGNNFTEMDENGIYLDENNMRNEIKGINEIKLMKNLCTVCHKHYYGDPDYDYKSEYEENYENQENNDTQNYGFDSKNENKIGFFPPVEKILFRGIAAMRMRGSLDRKADLKGMEYFYKKRYGIIITFLVVLILFYFASFFVIC